MSVEAYLGVFGSTAVLVTAIVATFTSVGVLTVGMLALAGMFVLAITRASNHVALSSKHITAKCVHQSTEFVASAARLSASLWLAWFVYSIFTTSVSIPYTVAVALVYTQVALTAIAFVLIFAPERARLLQDVGRYVILVPAAIPALHAAVLHVHPALSIARTGIFFAALFFVMQAMAVKQAAIEQRAGLAVARVAWILYSPWPIMVAGLGVLIIWFLLLQFYTDGNNLPYARLPSSAVAVATAAAAAYGTTTISRSTAPPAVVNSFTFVAPNQLSYRKKQ